MKKLIVNHTKKPSAILVYGARASAIKAEDLNAKRGTSCEPYECEALLDPVNEIGAVRNRRLDCDEREIGENPTLESLSNSALKWFRAHLNYELNSLNSQRRAMLAEYDLSRTIHVIATADIATNKESLRIYKTTLQELLDETAIPDNVLTVRGYETNLEVMLFAIGDKEYRFEERCRFHDRAPMAFDIVTSSNERKVREALDTLVAHVVSELLNPALLESGATIDEAIKTLEAKASKTIDLANVNDVQGREQLQAWMCEELTVKVIDALIQHFRMDCVLLVGAPFFNTRANARVHALTPGLFSVAPFDAQLGAMFHQLPDEVLEGNMCLCTRNIDSFDNVQGNDIGTAKELERVVMNKGYGLVIQGDAGLLDCINGHDLIVLKDERMSIRAAQVIGSPVLRPWRASHKIMWCALSIIGSDEYGLVDDSITGERVLTLQHDDLLSWRTPAIGSFFVLPLKHYRGGGASIMRYGETLLQPDLIIVEHE